MSPSSFCTQDHIHRTRLSLLTPGIRQRSQRFWQLDDVMWYDISTGSLRCGSWISSLFFCVASLTLCLTHGLSCNLEHQPHMRGWYFAFAVFELQYQVCLSIHQFGSQKMVLHREASSEGRKSEQKTADECAGKVSGEGFLFPTEVPSEGFPMEEFPRRVKCRFWSRFQCSQLQSHWGFHMDLLFKQTCNMKIRIAHIVSDCTLLSTGGDSLKACSEEDPLKLCSGG